MNQSTRFFTLILAAALMAACAGAPTATPAPPIIPAQPTALPTSAPPTPAPTATVDQTPVTLVYWAEPRFLNVKGKEAQTAEVGDYEKLLAEEFMRLHPNVTLQVETLTFDDLAQKVPAAIAAGAAPDLLKDFLGRTSGYAWQGLLEPLEAATPPDELADFYPDLIAQYTINGQLHGLPLYFWVNTLFGNKSLFVESGAENLVPLDDGEWTMGEFEAAMRAAAKEGQVWPLGLQVGTEQGDYRYLAFFWGMGAEMYANGDYSRVALNSPQGVAALEKLVEWNDSGLIEPGAPSIAWSDLRALLFNRQVGLVGLGMSGFASIAKAKSDGILTEPWEPFVVMYPHAGGVNSGGLAAGPTGIVVFKQQTEAERYWAIEFARFLASPELIAEYAVNSGQFPTRQSVGNPLPDDANYQRVLEWMQTRGVEDMGLSSPHYYEVRVLLFPQLQAAFLHEKTPAQALADYEAAANAVLAGP